MAENSEAVARPQLSELVGAFARIGLMSFGGPAAQIGLMHRVAVDEKRWISEDRFLHALNYCMLLPGPEAQQLATYIGWLTHGVRGGVVAGLLFVLPGLAVMLGLSAAYALYQDTQWLTGLFFGLKAAVLAIVIDALIRVGKRALKTRFHRIVAVVAFLALFLLSLPFPLVVLGAGMAGLVLARSRAATATGDIDLSAVQAKLVGSRQVLVLLFWVAVWQAPLAVLWLVAGPDGMTALYLFFSKMALVTFGGAYAVLAYVAQVAVDHYRWLMPGEMLDGLALAETTPGPLVLVLSFVGFLAGFRDAGLGAPLVGGVLGALLTAWATFVPSFIWIFAGAPYVERLRGNRFATAALSAITAAVVGVILNLALWFALHVLFARVGRMSWDLAGASIPVPEWSSLDVAALITTLLAVVMIFAFRQGVGRTLVVCAIAGYGTRLIL
ncbi:chromate efflux transporter [Agrobacterium sp. ES01]|uniref:chromate efflux transporter n=1 Tax=Agrobacterium sp. ES01 TaxID=3420714 RepID=UPI003D0E95B4